MIAFQFIPSTTGVSRSRRVDLAGLAGHFGEREEGAPSGVRRQAVARLAMLVVLLFGAIGDTLLVAQREALAGCLAASHPPQPPAVGEL